LHDAEVLLRRAIALRRPYAEAFSNLGNTLKEQERLVEAEAAYREAIAQNPILVEPYNNLGATLLRLHRLDEAKDVLDRAIALKADFAEAHHNAGLTLKHAGRVAEARQYVERAIALAPKNAGFYLSLTELSSFTERDGYLAAMEDMARNVEKLTVNQQTDLHFALGKAHEDIGRYDSAFRHLLRGNELKRRRINYDETSMLGEIDHCREVFTEEVMSRFTDAGDPSSVPVFIVGMPRSGSTLIEQILASHPQAFGCGELSYLADAAAAIRARTGQLLPDADRLSCRDLLRESGVSYRVALTRLAPGAKCIVDKMLSNFLYIGLIHLLLPNARIIHAVRDPADTCVSCFSKQFTVGLHQTYDLAELGRYYRHYHDLMQHWHRVLPPGRILKVHYEDVVADLEGQARRITAHCGLDWSQLCLSFHETERPVFTASSVQVRRPLYRHAVGRAQPYRAFLAPLLAELPRAERN
jgi:tetratricopeptide (TPR) repeat protein